jgi:hypothetical protein
MLDSIVVPLQTLFDNDLGFINEHSVCLKKLLLATSSGFQKLYFLDHYMVWIPEGIVIKLNHYTRKSKENSMQ